ncbi:uncharacterized protein [Drosophila virilis]|uniref:uncharacterized protein isoform X1 n=1 Tax=Drosophila virilis TaxID=7244 RepID=UPI0013964A54|nr:uncharacterized protein LOC26531846 isoform X2 [Drosophila virilis]
MRIAKFSKCSFEAEIIDSREDREILDQQCQELNKEAATKLNESEATTNDDKSEAPLAAYKSNTDTTNKSNLGQFEAFGMCAIIKTKPGQNKKSFALHF